MKRDLLVAVDFDGTIAQSAPVWGVGRYGDPVDGAIDGMRKLRSLGFRIIIWTCRGGEDALIRAYLESHGIPFDTINEPIEREGDAYFVGFTPSPKVVADFYIDDRSPDWRGWRKAIRAIEEGLAA